VLGDYSRVANTRHDFDFHFFSLLLIKSVAIDLLFTKGLGWSTRKDVLFKVIITLKVLIG